MREDGPDGFRMPPRFKAYAEALHARGIALNCIFNGRSRVHANPFDPQAAARWCAWAVKEFGDTVNDYELWNEPHNFGFRKHYQKEPKDNDGWIRKFVEFSRACRDAIVAERPGANVLLTAEDVSAFFNRMVDFGIARDNDVLSFTNYSDGTHPVRRNAGKIRIVDCTSDDTDRFLHYNYGNERWQMGKPMTDITFERVKATRLKMPFAAWGDAAVPIAMTFRECTFGFSVKPAELIRGGFVGQILMENVGVEGTDGVPLFRNWSKVTPKVKYEKVQGVDLGVQQGTGTYKVQAI